MFSVSAVAQGLTCPTAMAVAVPSSTVGDTLAGGGGDGPFLVCTDEYGDPGGWAVGSQWYSIVGTGNTVTASLCITELVNIDAAMVVVCNSECVAASEDACGASEFDPEISFCTANGVTYEIGIGDNWAPQGTFILDVWDDGTPCTTPPTCADTCGNNVEEGCEVCDGTDMDDCEVSCETDCTCTLPVCGNDVWFPPTEECDGTDNAACEVSCETDCTCTPTDCGNNIAWGDEECDGTDIGVCVPGTICDGDCTCPDPICPNNITEEGEECDGTDNAACEVSCETDCTCTPTDCGNNIAWGIEECDGTDIGVCVPGTICDGDCTCPDPICGNNIKEEGEDCDETDDDACPSLCELDCTCPAAPALPIWGIVGLAVLLAGGGATAVARRRKKA